MSKNVTEEFARLLQEIEDDDRNKKDTILNIKDLAMQPDGRIVRRGNTNKFGIKFSDHALTQAFNSIGIPVAYGKKLLEQRPDLVASQFNHWAWQDGRKVLLRTRVTNDGKDGMVRGFLSDKYTPLDNRHVAQAMRGIFEGRTDYDIVSYYLDDKRTHVRITFDKLSTEVGQAVDGRKDILKVGVDIDNSEVGSSSLRIVPMVFRLVCTNGLRAWRTEGDVFAQRHIHLSTKELFGRMSEAIGSALRVGDETVERMNRSMDIDIDDPFNIIEKLSKQEKYSQELTDTIKQNYLIEPTSNLYGVVNAITRTARTLKNERQVELEQFAGNLLTDESMRQFA